MRRGENDDNNRCRLRKESAACNPRAVTHKYHGYQKNKYASANGQRTRNEVAANQADDTEKDAYGHDEYRMNLNCFSRDCFSFHDENLHLVYNLIVIEFSS